MYLLPQHPLPGFIAVNEKIRFISKRTRKGKGENKETGLSKVENFK